MSILFDILIAIGLIIILPLLGGLINGIDRKISARMQSRKGPPVLQPFYDVIKLLNKKSTSVNSISRFCVLFSLVLTMFSTVLLFMGADLLLIIFTLTLTSVFFVIAGYSANSPYATVGAERELLQVMAYEPMVIIAGLGFYYATHTFKIVDIAKMSTPAIAYLPLIFVGYVFIITFKLRKSPFDLSTSHHGHQEIVKGITTEMTGIELAMVEVMHWTETMLVLGLVFLFFVSSNWIWDVIGVVVCIIVYFIEILIDNSFARFKWQRALTVSWVTTFAVSIINFGALSYLHIV